MTAQIRRGFTLIELLIVMAILGVLAVVVLVAINPVQQLARTRDAGRISTVVQIGHAVEAYYTTHEGTYPTVAQWTADVLTTTGEINQMPGEVNNTLTALCTTNEFNGWCYAADVDSFALYSSLEADTNLNLGICAGGPAHTAYLSLAGRSCIVCAAPGANTDDTACQN